MKKLYNNEYVEMTEDEIVEFMQSNGDTSQNDEKDSLKTLIEGLSSATSISQIRNVAKAILDAVEWENNCKD